MTGSVLLSLFFIILLVWSIRSLPGVHPVKLWAGSWSVATSAYTLHLLPYHWLGWTTVALIFGSTLALATGILLAERAMRSVGERPRRRELASHPDVTRWAAAMGFGVTITLATGYVAWLGDSLGWQAVVRPTLDVENAIATGTAPTTSAYTYCAIASSGLCALAATQAVSRTERRIWFVATAMSIATLYFSAGRMLIVIAGLSALITAATGRTPIRGLALYATGTRRAALPVLAVAGILLAVFIVGGAVSGKTLSRTDHIEVGTFSNVFSEHRGLGWAALPYQNVTAALPALDRQVEVTPLWGESHGCAFLAFPCRRLYRLGLPVRDEPALRPFTPPPLRWNTYTFLESALLDGGIALAVPIMALVGLFVGLVWWAACRHTSIGRLLYGLVACAMLFSGRQNLMAQLTLPAAVMCGLFLAGYGCVAGAAVIKRIRGASGVTV